MMIYLQYCRWTIYHQCLVSRSYSWAQTLQVASGPRTLGAPEQWGTRSFWKASGGKFFKTNNSREGNHVHTFKNYCNMETPGPKVSTWNRPGAPRSHAVPPPPLRGAHWLHGAAGAFCGPWWKIEIPKTRTTSFPGIKSAKSSPSGHLAINISHKKHRLHWII